MNFEACCLSQLIYVSIKKPIRKCGDPWIHVNVNCQGTYMFTGSDLCLSLFENLFLPFRMLLIDLLTL